MLKIMRFVSMCVVLAFCVVNIAAQNVLEYNGAKYERIVQDNGVSYAKVISYITSTIEIADSIDFDGVRVPVQDAEDYTDKTCALRHYDKIDFSNAIAITELVSQKTDSIDIDTLVLPPRITIIPNLGGEPNKYIQSIPSDIDISEWVASASVPIGIHRIFFSGTDDIKIPLPTQYNFANYPPLIEVDFADQGVAALPWFTDCYFLEICRLPKTVKTIGLFAFTSCYSLKSFGDVKVGRFDNFDNLLSLSGETFGNGPIIDTIHIGSHTEVTTVTGTVWLRVHSLKWFEVDEGNPWHSSIDGCFLSRDGKTLIRYPHANPREVFEIPQQIETLGYLWFCPDYAELNFLDNFALHEIIFHKGIKKIQHHAFFQMYHQFVCKNFEITRVQELEDCVFSTSGITGIEFPPALRIIGGRAFAGCYYLKKLSFSNLPLLRTIGIYSFSGTPLKDVDLLACESLSEIDLGAFKHNKHLSDEELAQLDNDDVLVTGIVSLKLPANLKTIGSEAFFDNKLQMVTCMVPEPIKIDTSVFGRVDRANCKLYVPQTSVAAYRSAPVWKEFDIRGVETCSLTVTSSDKSCGTTCGTGVYPKDYIATLTANPADGYEFQQWTDGDLSRIRKVKVTADASYTAVFAPKTTDPSVVEKVTINPICHVGGNTIFVDESVSSEMRVWSSDGRQVWSGPAQTITLDVPAGVYVISIGGESTSVVMGK